MISFADLNALIGTEVGVSAWQMIDQDRINAFAELTDDDQFIHTDPARAAETSLGGTISHGFLTLSLLAPMADNTLPKLDGVTMQLNYGFNRLRFVSPVPSGSRVRGRFTLKSTEELSPTSAQAIWNVTMEIENAGKPALVAEWAHRYVLEVS